MLRSRAPARARGLMTIVTAPASPTPLVVSDFKNGVYSINGVSKTLGELWVQNTDWGSFNAGVDVVAGTGLIKQGTGNGNASPASTAELFAAVPPTTGFTFVMTFEQTGYDGANSSKVGFEPVDLPAYNDGWGVTMYDGSDPRLDIYDYGSYAPGSQGALGHLAGEQRVAANMSPAGFAVSINGGAVIAPAGTPTSGTALTHIGLACSHFGSTNALTKAIIKDLVIYPLGDSADLPTLSAL